MQTPLLILVTSATTIILTKIYYRYRYGNIIKFENFNNEIRIALDKHSKYSSLAKKYKDKSDVIEQAMANLHFNKEKITNDLHKIYCKYYDDQYTKEVINERVNLFIETELKLLENMKKGLSKNEEESI